MMFPAGQSSMGSTAATHHEDGALDILHEEVLLLARLVFRSLDADLEPGADLAGEHTTECIEATLVRGGDHLGDVEHEGSLGVAVTDAEGALVILGTLIQRLGPVLLGGDGGWQVDGNHLEEGIGGGEELAHDDLDQVLALLLQILDSRAGPRAS